MSKTGLLELNAVAAVAQCRNFRQAAARLGISPSALSHAVAALEDRLGVRLFHRTTRAVSLTEAGENFLARIKPALQQIDEAMAFANQMHDTPTGVLRISATLGGGATLLRPIIEAYLQRYSGMTVDLVVENDGQDIVAGGFDAGVRPLDQVPRDMVAVRCSPPVTRAVVGSPAYFARHPRPLSPDDLAQHQCIRWRRPDGGAAPWEFSQDGVSRRVDAPGDLILDNPCLMVEAAVAGLGLAEVSEWALDHYLADGRLERVLEAWVPPDAGMYFYYPPHRYVSAALRCFVDVIRELVPPLPRAA